MSAEPLHPPCHSPTAAAVEATTISSTEPTPPTAVGLPTAVAADVSKQHAIRENPACTADEDGSASSASNAKVPEGVGCSSWRRGDVSRPVSQAQAEIRHVPSDAFPTLAAALAVPGGSRPRSPCKASSSAPSVVIKLAPGTYQGRVSLSWGVVLEASNPDDRPLPALENLGPNGLEIVAGSDEDPLTSSLAGVPPLPSASSSSSSSSSSSWPSTSCCVLRRLRLRADPGRPAVSILGVSPLIEGCEFEGAGEAPTRGARAGVVVRGTSARPVLRHCTIWGHGGAGLVFEDGAGGFVAGNDISWCGCGFWMEGGTSPVLWRNNASNCSGAGVVVRAAASGSAFGNVLVGNACGALVESDRKATTVIAHNRIAQSVGPAMRQSKASSCAAAEAGALLVGNSVGSNGLGATLEPKWPRLVVRNAVELSEALRGAPVDRIQVIEVQGLIELPKPLYVDRPVFLTGPQLSADGVDEGLAAELRLLEEEEETHMETAQNGPMKDDEDVVEEKNTKEKEGREEIEEQADDKSDKFENGDEDIMTKEVDDLQHDMVLDKEESDEEEKGEGERGERGSKAEQITAEKLDSNTKQVGGEKFANGSRETQHATEDGTEEEKQRDVEVKASEDDRKHENREGEKQRREGEVKQTQGELEEQHRRVGGQNKPKACSLPAEAVVVVAPGGESACLHRIAIRAVAPPRPGRTAAQRGAMCCVAVTAGQPTLLQCDLDAATPEAREGLDRHVSGGSASSAPRDGLRVGRHAAGGTGRRSQRLSEADGEGASPADGQEDPAASVAPLLVACTLRGAAGTALLVEDGASAMMLRCEVASNRTGIRLRGCHSSVSMEENLVHSSGGIAGVVVDANNSMCLGHCLVDTSTDGGVGIWLRGSGKDIPSRVAAAPSVLNSCQLVVRQGGGPPLVVGDGAVALSWRSAYCKIAATTDESFAAVAVEHGGHALIAPLSPSNVPKFFGGGSVAFLDAHQTDLDAGEARDTGTDAGAERQLVAKPLTCQVPETTAEAWTPAATAAFWEEHGASGGESIGSRQQWSSFCLPVPRRLDEESVAAATRSAEAAVLAAGWIRREPLPDDEFTRWLFRRREQSPHGHGEWQMEDKRILYSLLAMLAEKAELPQLTSVAGLGGQVCSGEVVFLRGHTGRYVSARPNGSVDCHAPERGVSEEFLVMSTNNRPGPLGKGDTVTLEVASSGREHLLLTATGGTAAGTGIVSEACLALPAGSGEQTFLLNHRRRADAGIMSGREVRIVSVPSERPLEVSGDTFRPGTAGAVTGARRRFFLEKVWVFSRGVHLGLVQKQHLASMLSKPGGEAKQLLRIFATQWATEWAQSFALAKTLKGEDTTDGKSAVEASNGQLTGDNSSADAGSGSDHGRTIGVAAAAAPTEMEAVAKIRRFFRRIMVPPVECEIGDLFVNALRSYFSETLHVSQLEANNVMRLVEAFAASLVADASFLATFTPAMLPKEQRKTYKTNEEVLFGLTYMSMMLNTDAHSSQVAMKSWDKKTFVDGGKTCGVTPALMTQIYRRITESEL
eukprot:TRINITY_DN13723_c0_g1_i1.p1 TRINITY_DN13723_c0_g1~~TRINITY_DN13723_c0_g1_i1.p1  ORF type:complete len:1567 (-),score=310.40 TRINITY_DN13723_c0_g1_i1:208-4809(-)